MAGESADAAVRKLPEFVAARGDSANALIFQSLPSRHASPELASVPVNENVLQYSPDLARNLKCAVAATRAGERSSDSWVDKTSASAAFATSPPPDPGCINPLRPCQPKNPRPPPRAKLAAIAAGRHPDRREVFRRPASRASARTTGPLRPLFGP